MPQIDPRTIIFVASVMSLQMAVVLGLMWRHHTRSLQGLGWWALAPLLWSATAMLFTQRGRAPDFLTVVVSNLLLIGGVGLHWCGTRVFFGLRSGVRALLVLLALSALILGVLTYVYPSYAARVVWISTALIAIYASYLRVLNGRADRGFTTGLLQVAMVLQIAVLVIRMVTVWFGMGGRDLLEPGPVQVLYLSMYAFTVLTLSIGSVLMANDRLRLRLEQLALHDSLTGVLNRGAVLGRLGDELVRARRSGRGPALLLIDMDHFKIVNDTHGHQHGDALLREATSRARGALRAVDSLGRYGGDEFIAVLPETHAAGAAEAARRVHMALVAEPAMELTVSIGISVWQGDGETPDTLLARADTALYDAKASGRALTRVAAGDAPE